MRLPTCLLPVPLPRHRNRHAVGQGLSSKHLRLTPPWRGGEGGTPLASFRLSALAPSCARGSARLAGGGGGCLSPSGQDLQGCRKVVVFTRQRSALVVGLQASWSVYERCHSHVTDVPAVTRRPICSLNILFYPFSRHILVILFGRRRREILLDTPYPHSVSRVA